MRSRGMGTFLVAALVLAPLSCTPDYGTFEVSIEPAEPIEGEALDAILDRDPEDADLTWIWFRDGEPSPGYQSASIPADTTVADERWTVLVEETTDGEIDRAATAEVRIRPALVVPPDADGDGSPATEDCDDSDPDVHPAAAEACDGLDNDCDGASDEGLDGDGDGVTSCGPDGDPATLADNDCDDGDGDVYPGAPESCARPGDDNCDPSDDEDDLLLVATDGDGDGAGVDPRQWVCGEVPEGFALCGQGPDAVCEVDCDDEDAAISPRADEVCDGLDTDCDGCGGDADEDGVEDVDCDAADAVDEVVGDIDADADGVPLCADDLDDTAPDVGGPTLEVCDGEDNDGDGSPGADEVDADGDGVMVCAGDCDDSSAAVAPTLSEDGCDGLDTDCDGAFAATELDGDLDGVTGCGPDGALSTADDDCDDAAPTVFGGAAELCDGLDNDCDGVVPTDEVDADGDGWAECLPLDPSDPSTPFGYTGLVGLVGGGDCDDDAAAIYPGAPEIADSYWDGLVWELVDNQCPGDVGYDANGVPDAGEYCEAPETSPAAECGDPTSACYACAESELDLDGDTQSAATGDCDDTNSTVYTGAPELCDGIDNRCVGWISALEADADGDGYFICEPDPLSGLLGGDCEDSDANRNPGQPEIVDGIENNCDGVLAPGEVDEDGDGYDPSAGDCDDTDPNISPVAPEQCNGLDDDCDGLANYDDPTLGGELDLDGDGFVPCVDGDCLDDVADLLATGYSGSNADAVAAAVFPGAIELCDGWANACDGDGVAWEASATTHPDEFDDDDDGFVECVPFDATAGSEDLSGGADCADTPDDIGVTDPLDSIYPGAPEMCDGWDNGCSAGSPYVGPNSAEWDDDGDQYVECSGFVPLGQTNDSGEPLLGGQDCLDEETVHFATGQAMPLSVAAEVNPGAAELCDGLNNDCSGVVDPQGPQAYAGDAADESDPDGDLYLSCTAPASWIADVGYGVGDCLDAVGLTHAQSLESMSAVVAAAINPGATEVCDGFNTDCSLPLAALPYDADPLNSPVDEYDVDLDGYIACLDVEPSLVPGFVVGDCLDDEVVHPWSSALVPLSVAAAVNPGMGEACDGLNTNCSLPYADPAYPFLAEASNETDDDGDGFIPCANVEAYIGDVGLSGGDCLDGEETHPYTGETLSLSVAAEVNPGAPEACDGLDTDCSSGGFLADEADEADEDQDLFVVCDAAASWIGQVGYIVGDCLDATATHPETGNTLSLTVAASVNPGASEACDGMDTDCSSGLPWADDLDENDADGDGYIECTNAAATLAEVGYETGDCLDEVTTHFVTGQTMGLNVAS